MYNPIADADEREYVYARSNKNIAATVRDIYSMLIQREVYFGLKLWQSLDTI